MKKIGIMTFHAAHNYGSVLQAYATQTVFDRLGFDNEIINYRLKNQKEFYNNLYSPHFGKKDFVNRVMKIGEHKKRKLRSQKFEEFINHSLRLTEKEYNTLPELQAESFDYSVLVSGSDQVWNKNCVAEFKNEPDESILGYFLDFGGDSVKRISYSSSFAGRDWNYISRYKDYLERYSSISVRESSSAEMLSEKLNREVVNTLDPTLVLSGREWMIDGTYDIKEKYVFVYTLSKYHAANELIVAAKSLADRHGMKVVCVAPFSRIKVKGVESAQDCGPLDFLSYIKSAELVVTNSFHGTAFSVNFNIPFYTIQPKNEKRKTVLLRNLGLESRIVEKAEKLSSIKNYKCDYAHSNSVLEKERAKTVKYIKTALREDM